MNILFRDDVLCVADKPSGLLVHRGWANDDVTALQLAHQACGRFVYPVHRLDRGASGVLVFALNKETAADLGAQFAEGLVEKTYLALVRGVLRGPVLVDHPLPRSEGGQERVAARTLLQPIESVGGYTLLAARPQTGRLHQIRRHCKHAGHPLIGDVNYGKGEHNRRFRSLGLNRLALHCTRLALCHPLSKVTQAWDSPLPLDFLLPLHAAGFLFGRDTLLAAPCTP